MSVQLTVVLSCGGRAENELERDAVSAQGDGDSQPGDGDGDDTFSFSGGSSANTEPATTLEEADQQLLDLLVADGHGKWLSQADFEDGLDRACLGVVTECEPIPAHIEFVIDRGSLMGRTTGTGRTHFDLVREMTEQVFEKLVGNPVGLSFSPPLEGGDCDFSIPAVPRASIFASENEQLAELMAALNSTEPTAYGAGEHSLVDAYHAARTRLGAASPAAIVLITEGEWDLLEGCGNPPTGAASLPLIAPELAAALEEAARSGIVTLIVGGPGSAEVRSGADARPFLSEWAEISLQAPCDATHGTTFEHFDMTGEIPVAPQLSQALRSLNHCVIRSFDISPIPDTPSVTSTSFVIATESGLIELNGGFGHVCGHGYTVTEQTAELCPETGDLLTCGPTPSMSVIGYCP